MATPESPSEASEFYMACRNGDVEFVKRYLTTSSPESDPNNIEPSVNSTPLHAASYYAHKEIVKLLLEHGCDRSTINGYGLTAYEEAANDEIRQLFKRPTDGLDTRRFQDESIDDCFDFVKRPKTTAEESPTSTSESHRNSVKTPNVQSYNTEPEKKKEIGYSKTSIAMCQSRIGRFIADAFHRDSPMSLRSMGIRLQDIIDKELVKKQDPQLQKANDLLKKFSSDPENGRIEYLIRLYTLETNFYRILKEDPIPLALPLYMKLKTMKDRFFQGQSYRGAKMDDDEILTYESAANNPGTLIQTKLFSSTSIKRSVAEEFLTHKKKKPEKGQRQSVLFIFDFPEKCDQAINLSRISNEQCCLSEFEDEEEVLILPWTLFQVDKVEKDSSTSLYTVYFSNVLLPRKNMFSSLKWILRHPRGSIDRFHEHFPEMQPELTEEQFDNNLSIDDDNNEKENV